MTSRDRAVRRGRRTPDRRRRSREAARPPAAGERPRARRRSRPPARDRRPRLGPHRPASARTSDAPERSPPSPPGRRAVRRPHRLRRAARPGGAAPDGRGRRRSARPASASGCGRPRCRPPAARSSTATATNWRSRSRRRRSGPILAWSSTRRAPPTALAPVLGLDAGSRRPLWPSGWPQPAEFVYVARQVDDAVAEQVRALHLPGISTYPESAPVPAQRRPGPQHHRRHRPGRQGHRPAWSWPTTTCSPATPGELVREKGQDGRTIPAGQHELIPPTPGDDLVLTLDRNLQYVTEQLLVQAGRDGAGQGRHGGGHGHRHRRRPGHGQRPPRRATPGRSSCPRPTWLPSTPTSRARWPRS